MFTVATLLCLLATAWAQNPFAGKTYYVNPSYQAELDTSIASCSGTECTVLNQMRDVPSAYWLDVKAKITGNGTASADGILTDAGSKLVVLIVYDLPNRDCHAVASNGEICCEYNSDRTCNYQAGGDCADGIAEYKSEYVDPLVAVFAAHHTSTPIVAIIEPDSMPNLATNTGDGKCGTTATIAAYEQGIAYSVQQIAQRASSVVQYLDGAHGGWLGWENNMQLFAQYVQDLGIDSSLHGFASNVANYQPLGTACSAYDWCMPNGGHQGDACCDDPCSLESQYNPANNEHNYVMELNRYFPGHTFVVDTGRNAVEDMRADCANWCNIRGAGVGLKPTTSTASDIIDAYFWLKTPGESDGCTQELPEGGQCARYDTFCGSADSIGSQSGEPKAPEAGKWFDYQVKMLARNGKLTR